MTSIQTFLVDRNDLASTRVRADDAGPLERGRVLIRVDRFALTANNVTYAAFGDAMSYWSFFPSGEDRWGCIPVWGFGTVVASGCEDVEPGQRFYGYYPMASHVVVQPTRVKPRGFVDGVAHREPLPALYNQYVATTADPLYDASREGATALLRPLFITSFALDDHLADHGFFGAEAVIVSSASSKTAYGFAWQLASRAPDRPEIVGLTSAGNADFVASLGLHDRVIAYDAIEMLDPATPVTYVDFAGDHALRAALHAQYGDAMRASIVVGASHVESLRGSREAMPLPGAKPTFFFAPAQIAKRIDEWGAAGFEARFADAWHRFTDRVVDPARPWMRVVEEHGADAVERAYRDLLSGRAAPDEGRVLSFVAPD